MRLISSFPGKHDDYVHDVKFDFYGRRLAMCSSDRRISVWEQEGGAWRVRAQWGAHAGSVWRVAWAHPEYGQLLASASFDRSVILWEEPADSEDPALPADDQAWRKRAALVDHRDSVQDVAFAPRHLGLRLATASLDGTVRIYEAVDPMNLAHWPLMLEYEVSRSAGVNCVCWNPGRFERPMLAVGCNDEQGTVRIVEYDGQQWVVVAAEHTLPHGAPVHSIAWAPALGRTYHLLATAAADSIVRLFRMELDRGRYTVRMEERFVLSSKPWRVEWNACGTVLAVSGEDGAVRLFKAGLDGKWGCVSVLKNTKAKDS